MTKRRELSGKRVNPVRCVFRLYNVFVYVLPLVSSLALLILKKMMPMWILFLIHDVVICAVYISFRSFCLI